jgi:ADP-heptose:LPS heptosyltransferase
VFYVLLSYLLWPVLRLAARAKRAPPKRILLIQTAKIGDMICATPLFREIKRAHPGATLAVMHDPLTAAIVALDPHVDERIPCQSAEFRGLRGKLRLARLMRRGGYDVAVIMNPNVTFIVGAFWGGIPCRLAVYPDFAGRSFGLAAALLTRTVSHRPDRLLIDAYFRLLEAAGVSGSDTRRAVYKSAAADAHVAEVLGDVSPTIGIAVSSGNKLKALGADKLARVIDLLHRAGPHFVVLIGTGGDKDAAARILAAVKAPERVIDTCGQLDLAELPALLGRLSLFIGVDSGITYMADAVAVPIVLIAGPVNPMEQRPTNSPTVILRKDLPCAPCAHVFRAPYHCAVGTRACIEDVAADEIVQAARRLLSATPAVGSTSA